MCLLGDLDVSAGVSKGGGLKPEIDPTVCVVTFFMDNNLRLLRFDKDDENTLRVTERNFISVKQKATEVKQEVALFYENFGLTKIAKGVKDNPTPRRRSFSTADPNDWTTTKPENTATVSTDHFRNLTDSSDKTNAV
ncbi:hypothetical protein MRX96_026812 [Rhipicephalus microplus]